MKKQIFIFFFLIFLFPAFAFAQQGITLEAFVDKPEISLEDQLVLTVRVSGGNILTEPAIPNRGNFEVLTRGSASHVEMVNGRLAVSKEYTYVLQPLKAGAFEIGPISIFVEGVEKQTAPISVTVVEAENSPTGKKAPQAPGGIPPGFPSPPMMGLDPFAQGGTPAPSEGQYKDIFVTAEVDNKNPYKNEQVIYIFKLYTSRGVGEAKLELPDFHDFWSEEIQKENKYYKELGGKRYVVSEFRVAIFPTKTGTLTISPSVLKAQVEEAINLPQAFNDPFFTMRGGPLSYRPRVFKTPELNLEVKELPAGAPAEFKGLVGEFGINTTLSKKDLSVGDSATLTIQISGRGNIKDAQLQPNFQIPGLKIYDDKPVQELKQSAQGISGTKTFKYALVPENPGKLVVPALNIVYFDPQKGTYETLTTTSYELSVVPGTGQEKLHKLQGKAETTSSDPLAEDIATIHTPARLKKQKNDFDFYYWVVILFAAPPIIFGLAYLLIRRQRWVESNSELLRKRKALSRAVERIKSIDLSKEDEIFPQISHILRDYLGDKLSLVGAALTPLEVESLLMQKGGKHPTAIALVEFMRELDASVYGGKPVEKGWEKNIQKKGISILKAVEKELFR